MNKGESEEGMRLSDLGSIRTRNTALAVSDHQTSLDVNELLNDMLPILRAMLSPTASTAPFGLLSEILFCWDMTLNRRIFVPAHSRAESAA